MGWYPNRVMYMATRSGEFKKKYSDHVPENEAIMQLYIDAEKRLYIGTHRHGLFICTPEMELIQQLNKSTQPSLSDDATAAFSKTPGIRYG